MKKLEDLNSNYFNILKEVSKVNATLIAVSKGQSIEKIKNLYLLGQRDFGENYAQELASKAVTLKNLCPKIKWHFIGHLQKNKVKLVLPWITTIHSIDSVELAFKLAKKWSEIDSLKPLEGYLEVNLYSEKNKTGFLQSEIFDAAREISKLQELHILGLMCIPPTHLSNPKEVFIQLKELEKSLQPMTNGGLSMGMSNDYKQAIEVGATAVRIGTALFGPRQIRARSSVG